MSYKKIETMINDARRDEHYAHERANELEHLKTVKNENFEIGVWRFVHTSDDEGDYWIGDDDRATGYDEELPFDRLLLFIHGDGDGYIANFSYLSHDARYPIGGTPGDILHDDDRYTVFSCPAEAALNALTVIDEAYAWADELDRMETDDIDYIDGEFEPITEEIGDGV